MRSQEYNVGKIRVLCLLSFFACLYLHYASRNWESTIDQRDVTSLNLFAVDFYMFCFLLPKQTSGEFQLILWSACDGPLITPSFLRMPGQEISGVRSMKSSRLLKVKKIIKNEEISSVWDSLLRFSVSGKRGKYLWVCADGSAAFPFRNSVHYRARALVEVYRRWDLQSTCTGTCRSTRRPRYLSYGRL